MDMKYNNLLQTPEPWKGLIFPDYLAISSAQPIWCWVMWAFPELGYHNAMAKCHISFCSSVSNCRGSCAITWRSQRGLAVHCVWLVHNAGFWFLSEVKSQVFLRCFSWGFFKSEKSVSNGHNNDFVVLSCVLAGLWNWAGNDSSTSRGKEIKSQ